MKVVRYPDDLLTQVSIDVTLEYLPDVIATIPEMTALMRKLNGAGLAAVQAGILRRYCLVEQLSSTAPKPSILPDPILLINPRILETSKELVHLNEGCLSLPEFREHVSRYSEITVGFKDKDFNDIMAVFEGFQARVVQHEIDHMNGVLAFEHISPMKKAMFLKKTMKGLKLRHF